MKTPVTFLAVFLGTVVTLAWGYPTTVPGSLEVCKRMTPGHGPSPQKSVAPYNIEVSKTEVTGGNNVEVTLSGNEDQSFKGFYLQARDGYGNQVGTFIPNVDEKIKTHNCGGIKNNAAHHGGREDKESITVVWTSPKNYGGTVTFTATFVEEFETFWTQVKSSPVTVSINFSPQLTHQSTALTDTRKESETTKETQESRVLNYNPYSPYSPMRNTDFASKEFAHSKKNQFLDDRSDSNLTSTEKFPTFNSKETVPLSLNRKRKRHHYIPKTLAHPSYQVDTIEIQKSDDDWDGRYKRPIQRTSINLVRAYADSDLGYTVPSYYNPEEFKTVVPTFPTPTALAAGYHKLDNPTVQHQIPNRMIPKSFLNDGLPASSYRPSYIPTSGSLGPVIKSHSTYTGLSHNYGWSGNNNQNSPQIQKTRILFPNTNSRALTGFNNHYGESLQNNYHPGQHGILVNDYDTINTGIVIPKGMEHFEIPRFGYLIFNPKRGPPFYIIPAPDPEIGGSHFDETFPIVPQPAVYA